MKTRNKFTALTSSAVIVMSITTLPASYADERRSSNPARGLAAAPAKPAESEQTPNVRIYMQITQLTGDQAIKS